MARVEADVASVRRTRLSRAIGWLAVVSSLSYFASDALEVAHGGFTTSQLWLTLVSEATLPLFVLGLCAVQRPSISKLGGVGAAAYAVAYGYFTWTVVYALRNGTPDFDALNRALSPTMTLVGVVMVIAGIGFGIATYRSPVFPRWTGPALGLGVVLVAATIGASTALQLGAVAVRDGAFVGMGLALIWRGKAVSQTANRPAPSPRGAPRASHLDQQSDQLASGLAERSRQERV